MCTIFCALSTKNETATLESLQPIACRLQLPATWKRHHDVFPIDKLKKYNADQQWPCQRLPPPPAPVTIGEDDDDTEYVVDRILDDTVYHSSKGISERHWLVGFEGYSDEHNEWLPEWCINTYTDENGEMVVNELWKQYEEKRERRLNEATGKTHYLKLDVVTNLFSIAPLHRNMRELHILILNPQHNEELYRTVIQKYPNASITTVGETDRDTSKGNSTHIQVQFSKVQEYSLFTTLGKPNIDLMIINPPAYQKTRFEDSSYNPYLEFERMFHLFQMISPTHWIFMRMESNHDLQSQRVFEQSYLSQRLQPKYYQGQVWTNLRHSFDLDKPKGYHKMLPFEQLRKDLVQDVSYRDKAVYSPKIDPADDFDKDHPVYVSDGV